MAAGEFGQSLADRSVDFLHQVAGEWAAIAERFGQHNDSTVLPAGFGEHLQAYRLAAGLNVRELAEKADKLAADLDAPAFSCDGQDAHAVETMISEVKDRGFIPDALICTLGAVTATDAMTGDTDVWLDEYRANVLAPVNFIRAVAPLMQETLPGV